MLKAAVLAVAIGTVTMLLACDAGALTLAPMKSRPIVENNMTLVHDGCGRGYYYSERWGRCVEARDYNRGYHERPYSLADCKHDCRERHAECNWRRAGYFNGCGVAYSSCLAACR
jgi:hypothetical protein